MYMKIFVMSDIHGSLYYTQKTLDQYEKESCDLIAILGDCLYHGPRNPLPRDYNPSKVALLLNDYKEQILAVRGNCDSEVDQMVLDFEMMGDYHLLMMNNFKVFMTHGHLYDKEKMPMLNSGDVFIHGHFHVPMARKLGETYYLNPGSITLPKENSQNSYAILTDQSFTVKSVEGGIIQCSISF